MSQEQDADWATIETLIRTRPWHEILDGLREKHRERDSSRWLARAQHEAGLRFDDRDRAWSQELYTLKRAPAVTALARALALPPRTQSAVGKMMAQFASLDAASVPPLTHLRLVDFMSSKSEVLFDEVSSAVVWALLAHTPLRDVTVLRTPRNAPLVDGLLTASALRTVETLALSAVDSRFLSALARAPTLGTLRILHVFLSTYSTIAPELLGPVFAPMLREFKLEAPQCLPAGADPEDALWAQPWPHLETLRFGHLTLSETFFPSLFAQAPALTALTLHSCPISAQAVSALVQSAPEARLRKLSLGTCGLSDASFAELLRAPVCASLESLSLWDESDVGPHTIAAIAARDSLTSLNFYSSPSWPTELLALRDQINARAAIRGKT